MTEQLKEKILVIRYRFIGDTILLIPFLRNLRKNNPNAQIDVTITSSTHDILKNCPYVDGFIFIDKNNHQHTYESDSKKINYKKLIKEKHYTKAYVLKRSFSAAWLAFISGIKKRIGFGTELRNFLLTKTVPYRTDLLESQTFLDVLQADGLVVDDGHLELWTDEEAQNKINDFIIKNNLNNNEFVIIHATSGNSSKQWNLENWETVIEHLANNLNAQILFLGASSDKIVYESIIEKIKEKLSILPVNCCGQFSLLESVEMIKRAKLLVGCDSGNLHIASAVGVPVIGIYGPMSVKKWGAQGENNILFQSDEECCPCALKKKCKNDFKCLTSITPNMIIDAINKYF